MRAWVVLCLLLVPGLAAAVPVHVSFSGIFGISGSGSVSGTVQFDPAAASGTLLAQTSVSTTDGLLVQAVGGGGLLVIGQAYDLGQESLNQPGQNLALYRAADLVDAGSLQGDRLLFVNFENFGGFNAAGGSAVATEFICQLAGCNGFNDSTLRRTGVVTYTVRVANVPEPGTLGLLGAGLLAFGLKIRRRRT